MTTPRNLLVDSEVPLCYHLVSRCVRQARLCGWDPISRRNYSYRKVWLEERLIQLASAFAVDLYAYAIMSNHFHLVVYYDLKASARWSDEEVARRWLHAFPPKRSDGISIEDRVQRLVDEPESLARYRERLGSLSAFMQHLKQPIARRANLEDGVKGHFFEQRFYSGALLGESELLAAMAYVDLNPVRAKIASRIEECANTSINRRLEVLANSPERLQQALAPLASDLDSSRSSPPDAARVTSATLQRYVERLERVVRSEVGRVDSELLRPEERRWIARVASLSRRQRAYGSRERLRQWLGERGMRPLEAEFP